MKPIRDAIKGLLLELEISWNNSLMHDVQRDSGRKDTPNEDPLIKKHFGTNVGM